MEEGQKRGKMEEKFYHLSGHDYWYLISFIKKKAMPPIILSIIPQYSHLKKIAV